jgi:hypothetical protein
MRGSGARPTIHTHKHHHCDTNQSGSCCLELQLELALQLVLEPEFIAPTSSCLCVSVSSSTGAGDTGQHDDHPIALGHRSQEVAAATTLACSQREMRTPQRSLERKRTSGGPGARELVHRQSETEESLHDGPHSRVVAPHAARWPSSRSSSSSVSPKPPSSRRRRRSMTSRRTSRSATGRRSTRRC